jgi:hypothetical protein
MTEKPKPRSSLGNIELDKAEKQFDKFESEVKDMTYDRMNAAPKQDLEPQTKISGRDISKSTDVYLKPDKTIGCRDKFNEDYREEYNFSKEYVQFIAENKEIIGEVIELWTRPFAGMPAEFWKVPVNKPVWGPRYLAERIKGCIYSRLVMQENKMTGSDGHGQYFGSMAVDTKIQRLDAYPVSQKRSVFMGANSF